MGVARGLFARDTLHVNNENDFQIFANFTLRARRSMVKFQFVALLVSAING